METYTYYQPKGKVTVVLLKDGEDISRGVAICNDKDNFNRKLGRSIAMGRAKKALYNQRSCKDNEIHREEVRIPVRFISKCEFKPILNNYEKKLLKI